MIVSKSQLIPIRGRTPYDRTISVPTDDALCHPRRMRGGWLARCAVGLAVLASAAEAKPHRVVVLDFVGPPKLADLGRGSVMTLMLQHYEVVPTKRWDAERSQATGHGPEKWAQAARQLNVEAVIDGWVDDGRAQTLTVAVLDASTGTQIDTFKVE